MKYLHITFSNKHNWYKYNIKNKYIILCLEVKYSIQI
jgi:hypothetical protein